MAKSPLLPKKHAAHTHAATKTTMPRIEERELIEKIRGVSILGVRSKTLVSAAVIEAACSGMEKAPLSQKTREMGHRVR
jgi:hypothetical protein